MIADSIRKELFLNLLRGEFGIEKESLRVTADGKLAQTTHPQIDAAGISRDFSESQVEFISGVHEEVRGACQEICMLQEQMEQVLRKRTEGAEFLWNYSNPPLYDSPDSIRIAAFDGEYAEKTAYRSYLAQKYGKVKMLYSGVHLNYSLPREFFRVLEQASDKDCLTGRKNGWYLRLCDVLMSDSWLIVALTAASPVADPTFLQQLGVPEEEYGAYASFRSSRYGYWNDFLPELNYHSFKAYLSGIEADIASGKISSIQELYYPIRLKPRGANTLEQLKETGINHIELRMFDLNPDCCAVVAVRDLIFVHLLIAYRMAQMLSACGSHLPVPDARGTRDSERLLLHQRAARLDFWDEEEAYRRQALALLGDMREFYRHYEIQGGYIPTGYPIEKILTFEEEKIRFPQKRYAVISRKRYQDAYITERMKEIRRSQI